MAATSSKAFSIPPKEIIISLLQKMVAEFMGTYIMMFLGCSSIIINERVNITFVGVAFTWTCTVIAMGYTFGHVSGCHMNPAVTIGFAAARKFPWKQVPLYAVAQVTGSTLASLIVHWLFNGEQTNILVTLPGGPNPIGDLHAVAWEIIISSILMLVILSATTDPRACKEIGGIVVAAVIFCNIIVAGKITGASMNPARSIGPAIVANNFNKIWIYIISPIVGTVIGSTLYNIIQIPKKHDEKNMRMAVDHDVDNRNVAKASELSGNSLEVV